MSPVTWEHVAVAAVAGAVAWAAARRPRPVLPGRLIDALPVGVVEFDGRGHCVMASDRAVAMAGIGRARLLRHGWMDVVDADDRAGLAADMARVAACDTPVEREYRLRRGDGAVVWVHAVIIARPETGGCIATMADVTGRRLDGERRRVRHEALRTVVEHSPDTIVRYDLDCRRVYVNPAVAEMYGVHNEGLLGGTPMALWPSPEAAAFEARIRETAATGRAQDCELTMTDAQGHTVIRHIRLVAETDADGRVVSVLSVARDVTRLTQIKAELAETARRLALTIDNVPGVIYRKRYGPEGGRVLYLSEAYATLTGRAPAAVVALPAARQTHALWHADDHAAVAACAEAAAAGGDGCEARLRLLRADGASVWVLLRERVAERGDGWATVEGLLIDVQAEMAAKRDLEDSEGHRRGAEARLREVRRFEALGQLAGGIAHDFNNLLGAMLGFAQFIIEDSAVGSSAYRHAARIVAVGHKGKAIVEQILNFSRQSEMVRSRFTPAELVTETVALLESRTQASTRFCVSLPDTAVEIEGDREQLGRVLMNLCINAGDALQGVAGVVTIGAHDGKIDEEPLRRLVERDAAATDVEVWQDDTGAAWAISGRLPRVLPHAALFVADTGIGMDAKLLEQVFNPFFTTKDRAHGTGLGLSVVHGIVLAHGGALVVRSQPGHGTRFEILLSRPALSPAQVSYFNPAADATDAKGRVLLVDDNADVCDATAEALRRQDYTVDAYTDPAAALAAFAHSPDAWDVLITDQIMPAIRGTELIRKAHALRPGLPCLVCTGYAEELTESSCKEAGALALLRKPVSVAELLGAVDQAVGGGRG